MSVGLSFTTGYFVFNLQQSKTANSTDIAEINLLQKEMESSVESVATLELRQLYYNQNLSELGYPRTIFLKYEVNPIDLISKDCPQGDLLTKNDKQGIFESYRCGRLSKLPADFFEKAPYLREDGNSYAYLYYLINDNTPKLNPNWLGDHIKYFHISELGKISEYLNDLAVQIDYKILSQLSLDAIKMLLRGNELILDKKYCLILEDSESLSYKVSNRYSCESPLIDSHYTVDNYKAGEQCFYRSGHLCWSKKEIGVIELFSKTTIYIFLISVVILILTALALYRRILEQRQDEMRKRHALRVLTHELRTPISALLLGIERINSKSNLLDQDTLESFLLMESEVYRLKRLAEKSKSYLETHEKNNLINFNYQDIESINSYIEAVLEKFDKSKIKLVPLDLDSSFKMDPYWVDICIANIIRNALRHGEIPIEVKLFKDNEWFEISIEDSGNCKYRVLEDMIDVQSTTSLGIGLSIVKTTVEAMGGKLLFSNNPTLFTVKIRNKND